METDQERTTFQKCIENFGLINCIRILECLLSSGASCQEQKPDIQDPYAHWLNIEALIHGL